MRIVVADPYGIVHGVVTRGDVVVIVVIMVGGVAAVVGAGGLISVFI